MGILNVLNNEKVQSRLNNYFDTFREETIGGISFNIMPPRQEVPLIKQVGYDRGKDTFEIVFDYHKKVEFKKHGSVVFIENQNHQLIGIQVVGINRNNIKEIELTIISTLDQVIKEAEVKVSEEPTPQNITNLDLESRKVDFFKDVITADLSNLVTAS